MDEAEGQVVRYPVGEAGGVSFDVAVWAPADAAVDLSFACMFEHEMPGAVMEGGLLHLDQALDGALTRLRRDGAFRAQAMETLLIDRPPAGVRAKSVMVIGLGDPLAFSPEIMERALRVAVREAVRLRANTVAFAPDLLDAGLDAAATANLGAVMLPGVLGALEAEQRLNELGYSQRSTIKAWSFDAGAHPALTAEQLRSKLSHAHLP